MGMKTVIRVRTEAVIEIDPNDLQDAIRGAKAVETLKQVMADQGMTRVDVKTKISTIRDKPTETDAVNAGQEKMRDKSNTQSHEGDTGQGVT